MWRATASGRADGDHVALGIGATSGHLGGGLLTQGSVLTIGGDEASMVTRGLFVLHDWIRQPLSTYLAWRQERLEEDPEASRRRGFRLFAVHNKYTNEDWQWLLAEAGFTIQYQTQLRPTHQMFIVRPAA